MISTQFSAVFGILAVTVALAAPVRAADNTPDPAVQREFGAKLLVCNTCHGGRGIPASGTIPIIWGQQEGYLIKQIHDFDKGDRSVEVMTWMSKTLTPAEQGPSATSFAKKTWPVKSGASASAAGPAPRGIAVCQSCHSQNFMGAVQAEGMTTPRLAGQNYEYLVEAMRKFADGERTNNGDMIQIMKGISPADRDAMAKYLAGL
jgi:cytochrome c553